MPITHSAARELTQSASLVGALMTVSTHGSSGLGLDQGLETLTHHFRDQLAGGAAAMPAPPSASKDDASPSRPVLPPGGLMELSNASLQRGCQG
jgi:hypothetical protein